MENYINQILEKNNRVIVPDFGAFIVKQRKPLTIVFNEFLQYNDGMLVDTISKGENIDREKAKEKIDDFVKQVVSRLDKGESYSLNKLGILMKSASGKISLGEENDKPAAPKTAVKTRKNAVKEEKPKTEQEKKARVTNAKTEKEKKAQDGSGKTGPDKKAREEKAKDEQAKKAQEEKLKAEQEKKIQEEKQKAEQKKAEEEKTKAGERKKTQEERETATEEAKAKTEKAAPSQSYSKTYSYPSSTKAYAEKKGNKRNVLIWVIAIVLINGILILAYLKYNNDIPSFFKKADQDELLLDEPVIEEDNYVTESYDDAPDTEQDAGESGTEKVNTKKTVPKTTPSQITGTRYYVVAGAFSIEQNADNLVLELRRKGFNAEKFGKIGNLHAVSYGVFKNKSDADQLLEEVQTEQNPEAWIKKVN
ncbi:MAG: SPOR domain-containing protein [Bacteroidales bacterium]|jgi:nucleoid DNA-binding protein